MVVDIWIAVITFFLVMFCPFHEKSSILYLEHQASYVWAGFVEGIQMGGMDIATVFLLWDISRFKFVHNFQASVRNKLMSKFNEIACCTFAISTRSAFVDGVQLNSVGTKSLTVPSSLCRIAVFFLQTLYSFLSAMLRFLTPKPEADEGQEKISAMVQH